MTHPIDLRSDTVTRPTPAMRQAIATAEVGDIQYDDDPSVNRLEARIAELLGKEAALWLPTGTQANQVALLVLTRRGDDVIVAREAHAVWHETGASGGIAGVQMTEIGDNGVFDADQFQRAIKPQHHPIYPPTTLVEIENTHNRMGGIIFPQADAIAICAAARAHRIASYLDGARLWNVSVETGLSVAALAAPFDLAMVSMSKGLGAPGGSLLAGPKDLIRAAVRYRRMLGGAMRQVGLFAAAADHALDHHVERLAEDHANAKRLAAALARSPRIRIDLASVQTNVLVFDIVPDAAVPDAFAVVSRARDRGLLINALSATRIRALTHLDAPAAACEAAARILADILG